MVEHLDGVIDFLVGDLGVGYLKLDYNINAGVGTDAGRPTTRAQLDWQDAVLDRHRGLTIENCASGGMWMDYAMLSRVHLRSTSDQLDFLRYAAATCRRRGDDLPADQGGSRRCRAVLAARPARLDEPWVALGMRAPGSTISSYGVARPPAERTFPM